MMLQGARAWLAAERPLARTVTGLRLPNGASPALCSVEDERIAGVFVWTPEAKLSQLVRDVIGSRTWLSEIWLVLSQENARLLGGCLPLHVGVRVHRGDDGPLALSRPATVNDVHVRDLADLLSEGEKAELARRFGVAASTVAVSAAGRLALGPHGFAREVVELIGDRSGVSAPAPHSLSPEDLLRAIHAAVTVPVVAFT